MNKSSLGVFGWLAQALISIFRMLTRTMNVVENSVNMAAASVEVAAEEQTIELTLRRFDMRKRLVDEASIKTAQREEVIQNYSSKSEEHKKMLNEVRSKLEEEVNKALLARKTE